MRRASPELTISPALVEQASTFVAEMNGAVVGVYILCADEGSRTLAESGPDRERGSRTLGGSGPDRERGLLRDLWVDPAAIGTGVGTLLWRHMLGEARRLAYRVVRIESDPNAEGFYLKMGARRVGAIASTVLEGRTLPLLEVTP
jgi:GNAT superfamily N-acetyltransferase